MPKPGGQVHSSLSEVLRKETVDDQAGADGPPPGASWARLLFDPAGFLAVVGGASLMASLGVWVGALLRTARH